MRNALITGASSGIGEEIARQLASSGYKVFLVARNEVKLKKLSEELNGEYFSIDLSKPSSAREVFEWLDQKNLSLHYLVNNAGIGFYGTLNSTNFEEYQSMIQLNVTSLVQLTYLFLPKMIELNSTCHILNVSSIAAFFPISEFSVYAGTKSFVRNFSESLAQELSDTMVTVTHVAPGGTKTQFVDRAGQDLQKGANHFMMEARDVARIAVSAAERGEFVKVPGIINYVNTLLPRILPTKLLAWIISQTFGKLVKSSTN
jgi:short-subunit dehydrogenase